MKNPDINQHIQPLPNAGEPPVPSEYGADSSKAEDTIQCRGQRQQTLAAGTVFGAFVGVPMGAVIGAAFCWLTGLFESLWYGVLIGALAGPCPGVLIGFKERKARGDLARPDIATIICVVFGLLPALLIAFQSIGLVRGKASGYLLLGGVFAGPMVGLVIGGMLDRAFEACLKKSWGVTLVFAAAGVSSCIAIVCLIDAAAYGPDPKQVGREAKALITLEWRENPDLRDATINNVTLARKGRMTYTGFADVILAGQPERVVLEVLVEDEMLKVSWIVEQPKERSR